MLPNSFCLTLDINTSTCPLAQVYSEVCVAKNVLPTCMKRVNECGGLTGRSLC